MLPPGLKNPFVVHKLDDTAALPPGDVPELHAHVVTKCKEAFRQARESGHSTGLLVIGEPGSGKSHLIAQVRQQLARQERAALVSIRLHGAYSGRLWRHVRAALADELMSSYADPQFGANGLLRLLRNRFPKWGAVTHGTGSILDWLLGQSNHDLRPHLAEFAGTCSFDYQLLTVLPQLADQERKPLIRLWLQGQQLGSKDLERLGLPLSSPSEQEQEVQAREVVLSFLRLAGDRTTLLICFDQIEAIQASTHDPAVLRQFATLVTDLLALPGPRTVATFIRPQLQMAVARSIEVSDLQKVGQFVTRIPALQWEQALRVARARLDAEPGCRAERRLRSADLDWPLGYAFLDETFQANKRALTPRHLILACHCEFDRLQKGQPPGGPRPPFVPEPPNDTEVTPTDGQSPPQPPAPEQFQRMWERHRDRHLARPQATLFDTVMAIGLPWLVELTEAPYVRTQAIGHRLGDIDLLFAPRASGQRLLGVTLCNHQPHALWRKLDRLLNQWRVARGRDLSSLVVLRSRLERTAEGGERRLGMLREEGANVLLVEPQQLAELAAFQAMFTAANEGDLTRNGRPVPAAEYCSWVKEALSGAVKELLDQGFGAARLAGAAHAVRPAAVAARQ